MSKTYNAYLDGELVKEGIVELNDEITHLFENLNANEFHNFQFSTVENGIESELSEEYNDQPIIIAESIELLIDGRQVGDDEDIFVGQEVVVEAMTEPSYLEEVDLTWSIEPTTAKVEMNVAHDQMVKVKSKEAKPFTVVIADSVTGIKAEAPINPKENPLILKSMDFEYNGSPVTGPISGVVGVPMTVSVKLTPPTAETTLSWRPEEGEADVNRTSATTANIVPVTDGRIRLNVIDMETNISKDLIINADKAPVDATELKLSIDEQYRKGDKDGFPYYEIDLGLEGIPYEVEVEPSDATVDLKFDYDRYIITPTVGDTPTKGTLRMEFKGETHFKVTDSKTGLESTVIINAKMPTVESFEIVKKGSNEEIGNTMKVKVGDQFTLVVFPNPSNSDYSFKYKGQNGIILAHDIDVNSTYDAQYPTEEGKIIITESLSGVTRTIDVTVEE